MQKMIISTTGFSLKATDRLITALFEYLQRESVETYLEIKTDISSFITISSCNPVKANLTIPIHNILYITSDHHYCDFHLMSGVLKTRMNFKDVISLFPESSFLDCNRGVLLSMEHISKYSDGTFLMTNGVCFSPRTKQKREIIQKYESYRLLHG